MIMRKKLLLTITCLALCLNFSFLQAKETWNAPVLEASEIYAGSTYYIQNTGHNLFLAAGGWWNTQAIVKADGLPVKVLNAQTGLYTLEFSSGNTLFRDANGATYTDNTKDNRWNIQLKDNENLTYTIQAPSTYSGYNANQYLGTKDVMESTNNGNAYVVQYDRDKDTYANYIEWRFLNITLYEARLALYKALNNSTGTDIDLTSYENIYETSTDLAQIAKAKADLDKVVFDYKVQHATPQNPADLTYYIVNPGFDNNENTGWTGAGTINYHEAEFFQKTFDMYQQINGFPAGKYTMKAQGFERPGNNDGGAAFRAGTEIIHARFYAKSNKFPERAVPFKSLYQHSYSGSGAVNGYTNTMAGAEILLADPTNYAITIADILLAEGDVLTIGAKSDFQQGSYWVLFDNFRLEYEGFDINDVVSFINEQITIAQELLNRKMQNTECEKLNASLTNAQQTAERDPLVLNDLYDANTQLLGSIDKAKISVTAYRDLQLAIDSALVVYADGNGNEAGAFLTAINKAKSLSENYDASLEEISDGTADVYDAMFIFRLANATGTVPRVITNLNYARGATMAFGRSTITGVSPTQLLEHGFCWSTQPEPAISDNKTTKYFSHNGNIYHITGLKPATVYYMRAYAITKNYAVGYGNVIKVITIPKGTVTYWLDGGLSGEDRMRVDEAMKSAVDYLNNLTSIQGHNLSVHFGSGTPTAEASYGGYMRFGPNPGYQRTGTALHEIGHTIGVGQHSIWYGPNSPLRAEGTRGTWLGERANKVVQFLDNNTTGTLTGDNTHMWPYGINGAFEDSGSEILYIGNSLIHQGLGEDGLPPTGGFATPAYTFDYDENVKYYIKNEDEKRGLNTSYLVEDATGKLVLKVMRGSEALVNDSAAWYFDFNPATCYYRIRNAATGNYFTYKATGLNGITLASKTTPGAAENFQLMGARVNTKVGAGKTAFTSKGYWIVRPEKNLNPPCFAAAMNGATMATTFNLSNTVTIQRWLILPEEEVVLVDQALPVASLPAVGMSSILIYAEDKEVRVENIATPVNIAIYDISGRLQAVANGVSDSYSQNLSEGVYVVSVTSANSSKVMKVIVR